MEEGLDTFFHTVLLDNYVLKSKGNLKIVLRFNYVLIVNVTHIKFKLYEFFLLDYSSHETCQSSKLQRFMSPPSTTCPTSLSLAPLPILQILNSLLKMPFLSNLRCTEYNVTNHLLGCQGPL